MKSMLFASAALAAIVACGDETQPLDLDEPAVDAATYDASAAEAAAPDATTPVSDATVDAPVDAARAYDAAVPAVACAQEPCVVQLAAGRTHYCARWSDGHVSCWGDPSNLGVPATDDPSFGASPVDALVGASDLSAGASETCAVVSDGTLTCFGAGTLPTAVPELAGATAVFVGQDGASHCATVGTGSVRCWNEGAQLVPAGGLLDLGGRLATGLAFAQSDAFVVTSDGAVLSWGSDPLALGRAASELVFPARPVDALSHVIRIAAGASSACAIDVGGRAYCWGQGSDGVLGIGSVRTSLAPLETVFPDGEQPLGIAVSEHHACATTTSGKVYCWGARNTKGELGRADLPGVYAPSLASSEPALQVVVGFESSCALGPTGAVRCWGDNHLGQLGRGTRDGFRHPEAAPVVGME